MGLRIHHLRGARQGEAESFAAGPVTIGRKPGSHVRLDAKADLAASSEHARIEREGSTWVFRDLGSSNGSWMNGTRIQRVELRGGEEIELGRGGPLIRVEIDEAGSGGVQRTDGGEGVAQGPEPKAVGSRTVAMMIQAALSKAQGARSGSARTTAFIREVAIQAVHHGSRRFKIVSVTVIILLVGCIAVLVWQLAVTREQVADLSMSKLGPSEIGEAIAERNRNAIYLLVYRTSLGYEQGFCTGFAVAADRLLTNAHCVMQIETLAREAATFYAALNEGQGVRYRVTRWLAHPAYRRDSPRPTADIGTLWVEGSLPAVVPLGDAAHVAEIRSGAQIFVFGFPGDLNDVRSPVATITEGVVGRITTLDGQSGTPENRHLLQYSAFTTKGTSGSPVFDKHGRVVAVNSGYYQSKTKMVIENPTTGQKSEADVPRDLSGYSFGIRVDLAQEVLR